MAAIDLRIMYRDCASERAGYLDEAKRIADLTIPSLEPLPRGFSSGGQTYSGYSSNAGNRSSPTALNRPRSDAGARAVKGFASTLVATLSPSNVRYFRFQTDTSLNLSESDEKRVEEIFGEQEGRIERWLAQHNFAGFSNTLMQHLLVEGNIGVKVDANNGLMMYPLRAVAVKRTFGRINSILFEEVVSIPDPDNKGKYKAACQYIYVDKQADKVWVQREGEDKATLTDEYASQYFIVTSNYPTIDNYARAYYSDHYGLLATIDSGAAALIEAQTNAAWQWLSYTGSTEVPLSRISAIKNREVVRLQDHDDVKPFSFGVKISDWSFIAEKLASDEQKLLSLSAVGLQQRAAQIQTATEVNAIRAELDALVGSTAQTISQSFYYSVVVALLDVLGIKDAIRQQLLAEQGIQIDQQTLDKLIAPIVVTGTPALAREADAQRMLMVIKDLSNTFGPQAVASFVNIPQVMKEVLDGLRVNTEGIIREQTPEDPNAMGQASPTNPSQPSPDEIAAMLAQMQQMQQQPPNGQQGAPQ